MSPHEAAYEHHRAVIDAELRAAPNAAELVAFVWSDGSRSFGRRAAMPETDAPPGAVPVIVYVKGERRVVHHQIGGA